MWLKPHGVSKNGSSRGTSLPIPGTPAVPPSLGEPASPGIASDPVLLVRGPADFPKVQPGDVLVCRNTELAWTPLFTIASAVATEAGGVLSHAAVVVREAGIPAVLAVPRATTVLIPSSTITINGSTGHVPLRQQP
ncbi:PEP-utilizing enzyme [Paeniglutamicibacter gangotriensis]|uniref:PEP-utilizing enzyme n=1 Tax=Paeniglutamicibacter gangotriensis TaxID=254787 RepID=UPI0037CA8405